MDVSNHAIRSNSRIVAVLGPTNTGKTYFAIQEMLKSESGVIGFPLRLLARENYDRVADEIGKHKVALVTGEEKIIPRTAKYFFCTVESMPIEQSFEFLAVDEIQLCADPERGHIFTDRLLRARGRKTTMFLGSDTMRVILSSLIPNIEFQSRERLSRLSYTGFRKMTRLPKRSAIVAFSVDDVYAIADMVRSKRGGAAIVLGALSPRARNKQVEMYQAGEVDYMVATDAIGMGLNMDINHVALASTRKYDGRRPRDLKRMELAQIAGRAGRYLKDGTFGVTGRVHELEPDVVESIQNHSFQSIDVIHWRNARLDFKSPKALLNSLDTKSGHAFLMRGRPSDDYTTLQNLMDHESVMARASNPETVRLLWDVCQIPDFRKTMHETHDELVAQVYTYLLEEDGLPDAWIEDHIGRLDNTQGDVDTLMARIAHIRTWTYITHRKEWLKDAKHWQEKTLEIEDRLSDALHAALIQRFVDKRSSVLMSAIENQDQLLAGIKKDGEVVVEGQRVGQLIGFRFIPDITSGRQEFKAVMGAARNALRPEIRRRIQMLLESEDKQFTLEGDGRILWRQDPTNPLPGMPFGALKKGESILKPKAHLIDSDLFEGQDKEALTAKLQSWLDANLSLALAPLFKLIEEDGIDGQARGVAFQLHEALGIVPRADIQDLIDGLTEETRAFLRKRKIRMGPVLVFLPELNKPAAVKLRAALWNIWNDLPLPAQTPNDGMVSISIEGQDLNADYYRAIGYPVYGPRAIRVDMLDRVISAIFENAKDGKFQAQHQMAEWLGANIPDLYKILEAMGHKKIHDPMDEKIKEETDEKPAEDALSEGKTPEEEPPAEAEEAKPEEPKAPVKPELATFALRKGKAGGNKRPPKKDFKKDKSQKPKGKKPPHKKKQEPRTMSASAQANPDDSPFAILQQLKTGSKEQ